MSEPKHHDFELLISYPFSCPQCEYVQMAVPSIFMEMGINAGHGRCLRCGTYLSLEIAPENDRMIATMYGEEGE